MRSLSQLIPALGVTARPSVEFSYRLTDRLHAGRTARVPADGIGATIAAWLADFDVDSPMVDDLARALRCGDWPTVHALAEQLSIDVSLAA